MADTAIQNPAIAAVLKRPFAEQVAFFRAKLGNLVPTAVWTDMLRAAHDRGFMVAGAQSADLLADLAAAVDRAETEGVGIETFRKDFRAAVAKAGWAYNGEFNWRTRTIYRTNIATSYAAGRLAQLREGGFAYYLYKHGDSLQPRAQHLAWDGLVLPADHPFWKAHYPPNGWGCSCRVVGLRRPEDATALGGDPDKKLPDNWNVIDPKTGAPVGIGKGWDYAPGDTVSDTVAQVATKAARWNQNLARAYMQNVPENVRDRLARAYRDLPSVATDARLYAQRLLEKRTQLDTPEFRTLGLMESANVKKLALQRAPDGRRLDLSGYDWVIDRSSVGHVERGHGVGTEPDAKQRGVTANDYAKLPSLLNDPDVGPRISSRLADSGLPAIVVEKVLGGERYVAIFEVRRRQKMLVLKTFYIRRQ